MKKALVTGSLGFVGTYLRTELEENGYDVVGLDLREGDKSIVVDLLNTQQIQTIVAEQKPDIVIHLAGQANVALSWQQPQLTMENNVIAAINLLEAVKSYDPKVRIVLVGSSDQYGNLGEAGKRVQESMSLNPQTPYAVSKRAQEDMARIYAKVYGMNICMTRSFNHGGAGQRLGFLIPDFAAGIVQVERGKSSCLRVGNLESRRDFTHVKDVVRAYRMIAERGRSGEVYNVGSGITYSAQEILDKLRKLASCSVPVERDPGKMRPSDTRVICCDHSKLTRDTGWQPEHTMDEILYETLEFYRNKGF